MKKQKKAPKKAPSESNFVATIKRVGDFDEIDTKLTKSGYRRIGSGYFSDVYSRPESKKVIKVCTRGDAAWIAYTQLTKKHDNKHLLKVHKLKKLGRKFIAVIEKLKDAKDEEKSTVIELSHYIRLHGLNMKDFKCEKNLLMKVKKHSNKPKALVREILAVKEDAGNEALAALMLIKKLNYISDLHDENIMARADGTLVITDPVCN